MKITPSALIDTISQTSGGTTIQNSYGGLQLHKKAYQKKKKSTNQQNTRSAFANVQTSWRELTTEQQETWITAAPGGVSGFELYSSTNNILVGQGLPIIPEYIAPVTPITNDAEKGPGSINYGVHPYYYNQSILSPGNNFPTSGWTAYIKWTGWIQPSQFRYPPAKLTVPQKGVSAIAADEIFFEISEANSNTFNNLREGSKAQFIVSIINNTTGQIQDLLTYEIIA